MKTTNEKLNNAVSRIRAAINKCGASPWRLVAQLDLDNILIALGAALDAEKTQQEGCDAARKELAQIKELFNTQQSNYIK